MKPTAKCHNHSGCLRAYRGELVEMEVGTPLICPECSQPLTIVQTMGSPLLRFLALGTLALLGGMAYLAISGLPPLPEPSPNPAAQPATPPPERPDSAKGAGSPAPAVSQPPTTSDSSQASVVAPPRIDLDLNAAETKKTRAEVLERVDLMPNVSQSNKDKLYASVDRARKMGKLLRITFPSGKTSLLPEEAQALKTQLESPALLKLRDDPTAVFVLLGYADPKGDPQKNLVVSQTRADTVLAAMRDKCGVVNLMHAVGMGESTLLDAQDLDKNRAVEVWVVLP
jgi:outer membrane protein OmpA-like peptidoglycan-associated protein